MTGPTGLLNFFVLEATEYVDELDGLLNAAGPAGPDAEAFTRAARALRGSATMARLTGISALAAAVERLGRGLREHALPWTPLLAGALTGAVDDLRHLVRGARSWGTAEEGRAQERTAELLGFAPLTARTASPTPVVTSSGALFVVSGCTDVAAALSAAAARPGNVEHVTDALRKLRALRGVAALKDHPPLADVLDAVERAARPAESRPGPLEPAALVVLSAAARLLRRAGDELRAGRRLDANAPEMAAFNDAVSALDRARAESGRVVPIAELYPDDEGPHVLHTAAAPATTLAERFRLETAAAGEHLRRVVADARAAQRAARRAAADQPPRTSPGRGVPRVSDPAAAVAAHDLATLVRSFGHTPLAEAVAAITDRFEPSSGVDLAAADAVAALFVAQRRPVEELTRRASEYVGARAMATLVAVGLAPLPERPTTPRSGLATVADTATHEAAAIAPTIPPAPTPSPAPAEEPIPEQEPEPQPIPMPEPWTPEPQPERPPERLPEREPVPAPVAEPAAQPAASATTAPPTGRDLHALLESGIAGISRLQSESEERAAAPRPAASPTGNGDAAGAVPIEELLYRGRAALGRAIELRDEIRREGGSPSSEQLDELFDLLDLAALP